MAVCVGGVGTVGLVACGVVGVLADCGEVMAERCCHRGAVERTERALAKKKKKKKKKMDKKKQKKHTHTKKRNATIARTNSM